MSGKGLPAVLRTNTLERPENQDINTDILRPVNFSQNGCKFVFEKKGILDSNSQLQLQQIVVDFTQPTLNTGSYLPTSTGAMAMVRRAFLTIGGRRISNLDDVGHFGTWRRLHFSNEYKEGIVIPKQGGNDIFVGSASRTIQADSVNSTAARGFANPQGVLGRESSEFAINSALAAGFGTQNANNTNTSNYNQYNENIIGNTEATSGQFTIGLSQLIPFLVGVQLPLFAIKEEVAINIEWSDPSVGHRFYAPSALPSGGALVLTNCSSTMIQNGCLIMADYLYYPELMMELAEEIMSKGGYDIAYDEILTQTNHTTYLTGSVKNDYQLAFGGKKVKSIIVQKQLVDGADESINNLARYNSKAFINGVSMQLNIDSKNWYSQPLSNASLQKSEADLVEGVPVQLCDYRWSLKNQLGAGGSGLSDRTTNGYAQSLEQGTQKWLGIKLENEFGQGVRVSNLPMIYSESMNVAAGDNTKSRRVRFFVKTQRLLNISNGLVNMIE